MDSDCKPNFQWISFYVALTKAECLAFHKTLKILTTLNKQGNTVINLVFMGATRRGKDKQKPIWFHVQKGIVIETILPLEFWHHWNLIFESIPLTEAPIGFSYSGHHDGLLLGHKSFVSIDHDDLSSIIASWINPLKRKLICLVFDTCWSGVENLLFRYHGLVKYIVGSPGYWDDLSIFEIEAFHNVPKKGIESWLGLLLHQWVIDPRHEENLKVQAIFAAVYNMKKLAALHKQILKTITSWKLTNASLFEPGSKEGYSGDDLEMVLQQNHQDMKPFNDFIMHYEYIKSTNKEVVPKPCKLAIFLQMVKYRPRKAVCKSVLYYQNLC
jgi:hypothetical protein